MAKLVNPFFPSIMIIYMYLLLQWKFILPYKTCHIMYIWVLD